MDDLALHTRSGLPDALRVLVEEIPREAWQAHPEFGGMVQFWLERHLMFRDVLGKLQAETRALIDRKQEPAQFAPRLSRLGGFFLTELHGHHHVEDAHYFPKLIGLDRRLERGFGILDADHHALDGLLNGFAEAANGVLRSDEAAMREAGTGFAAELERLERLLDRHLCDEEEIVVPVILRSGFQGQLPRISSAA